MRDGPLQPTVLIPHPGPAAPRLLSRLSILEGSRPEGSRRHRLQHDVVAHTASTRRPGPACMAGPAVEDAGCDNPTTFRPFLGLCLGCDGLQARYSGEDQKVSGLDDVSKGCEVVLRDADDFGA